MVREVAAVRYGKALITFAENLDTDPAAATTARYVIDEVLSDPLA